MLIGRLMCVLVAGFAAQTSLCAAAASDRVTILHTNDSHTHVDDGAMFMGSRIVNNAIAMDYLVLAEYAKHFAKGMDGMSSLVSPGSPLAKRLKNYRIAYERPEGAGRITFRRKFTDK